MVTFLNLREHVGPYAAGADACGYRVEQIEIKDDWLTPTILDEIWKIVRAFNTGKDATGVGVILDLLRALIEHSAGLQQERDVVAAALLDETSNWQGIDDVACWQGSEKDGIIHRCVLRDGHVPKKHVAVTNGRINIWSSE